jgi:ketosteroid isomerase-like protein
MRIPLTVGTALVVALAAARSTAGQTAAGCAARDSSAAASAIRQRLAGWVAETNAGDEAAARTIWAPGVTGWFPRGAEFTDSAAYRAAGLLPSAGPARVSFEIRVDEVAVSGSLAAVHDVWTETRRFPTSAVAVRREIRGSELWACQPDGSWRIRRWVSAPEHWVRVE